MAQLLHKLGHFFVQNSLPSDNCHYHKVRMRENLSRTMPIHPAFLIQYCIKNNHFGDFMI